MVRVRRRGLGVLGATLVAGGCLVFGGSRPALANSVPVHLLEDDEDEAFEKQVQEVEKQLNELLSVDEDEKVHVKKEFRDALPMPAEQIERMLQMAVKVGENGKVQLRNPEQIRPFLPQIQGFLKQGGAQRLKELAKKSPEEQREELEKLRRQALNPQPPEDDKKRDDERKRADDERKRAEEKRRAAERERAERDRERDRRPAAPRPPEGRPERPMADVYERLERLEQRLERMTRILERLERERATPARPARPAPRPEEEPRRQFFFRERPEGERRDGPREFSMPRRDERWVPEPWGWRREPGPRHERDRAPEKKRTEEKRKVEKKRSGDHHPDMDRRRHDDRDRDERRAPRGRGGRDFNFDFRELRDMFRGGDRDFREFFRDGGEGRNFLERLRRDFEDRGIDPERFFRRGRDRDEDEEDDDDSRFDPRELGDGARDFARAMKKLRETVTPEDMERIRKTAERLRKDIRPEDLQDQSRLMDKLQQAVAPEDMPRFMEILGELMGSPEGQAVQKRLDKAVRRFEDLRDRFGRERGGNDVAPEAPKSCPQDTLPSNPRARLY